MEMWQLLLSVMGLILVGLMAYGFFRLTRQLRRLRESPPQPDPAMLLLQQQVSQVNTAVREELHQITAQVNQRLQESAHLIQQAHQTMGERLDRTVAVVGEVHGSLGRVHEATHRMLAVGQDIASLQQILRPPQLRGGLGETLLAQLLGQILPRDHYSLQHTFRSGEKVDAIIRIGSGVVPVDAKFPLENFRRMLEASESEEEEKRPALRRAFLRDVKGQIDEIARKYILPDEGTFDFALMYIPAENVYYEVIIKDEGEESLAAYALQRKVIPVSPNSFYAYLQAIILGLKGLRIERNAREIMELLARLQGDLRKFRERFDLTGKHLTDAKNRFEEAAVALARFEAKLDTIEGRGEQPTLPGMVDSAATLPS